MEPHIELINLMMISQPIYGVFFALRTVPGLHETTTNYGGFENGWDIMGTIDTIIVMTIGPA